MFFVEYVENGEKKALNLAMCQTIETHVTRTSGRQHYVLYIHHREFGKKAIEFETEKELLSTFDDLMNAVKACQTHWFSQNPLRENL